MLIKNSKPQCIWEKKSLLGEGTLWVSDLNSINISNTYLDSKESICELYILFILFTIFPIKDIKLTEYDVD